MQTLLTENQLNIDLLLPVVEFYGREQGKHIAAVQRENIITILTRIQYLGLSPEDATKLLEADGIPFRFTDHSIEHIFSKRAIEFTGEIHNGWNGIAHNIGAAYAMHGITLEGDTFKFPNYVTPPVSCFNEYGGSEGPVIVGGRSFHSSAFTDLINTVNSSLKFSKVAYACRIKDLRGDISMRELKLALAEARAEAYKFIDADENDEGITLSFTASGLKAEVVEPWIKHRAFGHWELLNHIPSDVLDAWIETFMDTQVGLTNGKIEWDAFTAKALKSHTQSVLPNYVSFNIGDIPIKTLHKDSFRFILRGLLEDKLKILKIEKNGPTRLD